MVAAAPVTFCTRGYDGHVMIVPHARQTTPINTTIVAGAARPTHGYSYVFSFKRFVIFTKKKEGPSLIQDAEVRIFLDSIYLDGQSENSMQDHILLQRG